MRTARLIALLVVGALVLFGCDDDGDGGGDDLQAYCEFSAELDEQEELPSDEQLDRIRELAPDEISDDVDFVAAAIEERGEEAFGDPEVGERLEEEIEPFEQENCDDE